MSMLRECCRTGQPPAIHTRGLTLAVTLTRTCAARATEPRRATCTTGFKLLAPKASATGLFVRSCAALTAAMRGRADAAACRSRADQGMSLIRGYGCRCRTDNSCQAQGQGQGSAFDRRQSDRYLAAGVVRGAVQPPPGRRQPPHCPEFLRVPLNRSVACQPASSCYGLWLSSRSRPAPHRATVLSVLQHRK